MTIIISLYFLTYYSIANRITSLDLNPDGETIATIDRYGMCLIASLNTNDCNLASAETFLPLGTWEHTLSSTIISLPLNNSGNLCRCRWSTNIGEPLLFVKYGERELNILDVEKKTLTFKDAIPIEQKEGVYAGIICAAFYWFLRLSNKPFVGLGHSSFWIDVCPTDGNLLASGGEDKNIKIFDRCESSIVKISTELHSSRPITFNFVKLCLSNIEEINCVRWHSSGTLLATASADSTAKVLDIKTEDVVYTGTTSDQSNFFFSFRIFFALRFMTR